MPTNEIYLRKNDTQKLFDFLMTTKNSREISGRSHGVYCVLHNKNHRYVPLYVGSSTRLKQRASRFLFSKQNLGNIYCNAIVNYVGRENIVVGLKFFNLTTAEELIGMEREYQCRLKPLLNESIAKSYTDRMGKFFKKNNENKC